MLKSLSDRLGAREKKMKEKGQKAQQLAHALDTFLQEEIGKSGQSLGILTRYDGNEDVFVIRTNTKTIATELAARKTDIQRFLKEAGLLVKQVLIH